MPSTTSSSVWTPLASSTVMTPSLPTFCIASEIIWPISTSPFALTAPTCAVSLGVVIFLVRFSSSSTIAFAPDRLRQHRRRGGTVTGGVAGLAGDRAHHLRAHVLELVGQFDFLGDGHAVLGDARGAEALVEHDVAALGAQRHLHRVGENVDAAQHPLAGVTAEANFLRCHVLSIPV